MQLLTPSPRVLERTEFSFPAPADVSLNVFDTREVELVAVIHGPDGSAVRTRGFAFRPHRLDPVESDPKAIERAIPTGPMEFRLRHAALTPGTHRLVAHYRFAGGATQPLGECAFHVEPSAGSPGFIRVSPNRYTFRYDNGEAFYPIGSNICWPNMTTPFKGQKQSDQRMMLTLLAEHGGNSFRLWANTPWAHALDWTALEDAEPLRFGQMNLGGCAKLDSIVETSERLGLRIMFCIDAANNWGNPSNVEARCPYHKKFGGPISNAFEYFESPEARAMTREKMKYVAARWGYSTSVWCWEFWNEVDGCNLHNVNPHQQLAWHEEMARTIREADPNRRLVTTSTGHPLNFAAMWRSPDMEFTHTHHYGYMDSVDHIGVLLRGYHESNVALYRKPHIASETGVTFAGHKEITDPQGTAFHHTLWSAAILAKSCGPGYIWSWDSYVHQKNLYPHYRGIASFLRDERWHEHETADLPITVHNAPDRPLDPPGELKVSSCLSGSDFFRSVFDLPNHGQVPDMHLIPNTLYGTDKPFCHFRLTFNVNFPVAGRFTFKVWGGGNNCNGIITGSPAPEGARPIAEIRLDDAVALRREVTIKAPEPALDGFYADLLVIDVPAGRHTVTLENVGQGNFITGHYILTNYRLSKPRLITQGFTYPGRACLWVCNHDYNWWNYKHGQPPTEVAGAVLDVTLPEAGRYRVEWWDTIAGTVRESCEAATTPAGRLTTPIPAFTTDLAAKLHRIG